MKVASNSLMRHALAKIRWAADTTVDWPDSSASHCYDVMLAIAEAARAADAATVLRRGSPLDEFSAQ